MSGFLVELFYRSVRSKLRIASGSTDGEPTPACLKGQGLDCQNKAHLRTWVGLSAAQNVGSVYGTSSSHSRPWTSLDHAHLAASLSRLLAEDASPFMGESRNMNLHSR